MPTFLLIASLFCAVVPMLIFLGIVWWLDRYDREPLWLVGFAFAWGALVATFGSLVLNEFGGAALTLFTDPYTAQAIGTIVLAPLIEEPMKASVLVLVVASRAFDNATDGFVYGAAVGLGFAVTENFMYFSRFTDDFATWAMVVLIRTACSGMLHAMASSIVGAALGWAHCRTMDIRIAAFFTGLAIAMNIHLVWNALVVFAGFGMGHALLLDIALFGVELLVVFMVFMACLQGEHRMIIRELKIEAQGGVLPPQHVAILASVRRRSRVGWCPPNVDQAQYVKIATRLAIRRMQCRVRGNNHNRFHAEARQLRHALRTLLGTTPLPPASTR